MRAAHGVRGSALPETVLVLTATLAMVFGIVQIGLLGYLQLMVDGAAFVAAHEYALGNTATAQQTAQKIFPQMGTPIYDANNPNTTTVPVNYNTQNTSARRGGVSLVLGSHQQATVVQTAPGGLLGLGSGLAGLASVSIHGSAVEPNNLVSNDVYDVNAYGYSGNTSPQVNFYTDVQNSPANYISQHEMSVCTAATFSQTCNSVDFRSLGTAEFLDVDNWARTTLGVGPCQASGCTSTTDYTFAEMLCHQQKFVIASSAFTATMPAKNTLTTTDTTALNVTSATASNVLGQIYSWDYDVALGGGYGAGSSNFYFFPMHPAYHCGP